MAIPSLRQLEYLVTLSEELNFRKAAARVHVSQPTLSGQILELERRLGVVLFERSRHAVHLTPIGKASASRARQVLKDVEDLCDLTRQASESLGGVIRLGVPPTLGPYLLPYVVPSLHNDYPDLKLYIREEPPKALEHSLLEGTYDLLLTAMPVMGDEFTAHTLFHEPLLVGLPAEDSLSKQQKIRMSDLTGKPVLALENSHRLYDQVQNLTNSFGGHLQAEYEGTSLDTLRQMVGMGMGISFFPALYVRSEMVNDSHVVARPMKDLSPARTIGLVWRKGSLRSNDFEVVAEVIRKIAANRLDKSLTLT